ncbi:MAG: Uma2 family endonuclease [Chloroflexota bacterium]
MQVAVQTRPTPRRRPPAQGRWTYADYARLPNNGMRYEVIRGELYMSPAPSPIHQRISLILAVELFTFVEAHKLGRVYTSPIDVNLLSLANPVQPDVLFISRKRLSIIKRKFIEGAPDLIMEVLSPGNPEHDRRTKLQLYAEAGVREYWIVDPEECAIDIYVLRGQAYALLGRYGAGEQTQSEVLPEFAVNVDEICQP